jgi:hypothetical protein
MTGRLIPSRCRWDGWPGWSPRCLPATLIIDQDELELVLKRAAASISAIHRQAGGNLETRQKGRESLSNTNDDFLGDEKAVRWAVVMEELRHVVLRDTLNHLAHHRAN